MLHATLSRFDDQDAVLTIATHHTACHGWSLQILLRDLAEYYAARTEHRHPDLPAAPTYVDYARWQREQTEGPEAEATMAYWHRRLAGAEVLALPADRTVSRTHATPYESYRCHIEVDVVDELARLAKSMRASMFILVIAVFSVLAHRIGGTLDPAINTIVHGRANRGSRRPSARSSTSWPCARSWRAA